jgi:hypothetical protein
LLFLMIHNPCLLLLLQLLLRIEATKRGKEKERLTWTCYLKTKTMVMEGWLTNVTFFSSTSVFRSLHLCSCSSLLVFSLSLFFFLYLLFPLSLSVIVPLCLSLYYLCLFIFRLCFFVLSGCDSPLLCGFSLFVLISLGLYCCAYWTESKHK